MNQIIDWLGDAGPAALVTGPIALGSLVVSILAYRKSSKTQERLLQIEEAREQDRITRIQKAELLPRIVKKMPGIWSLVITNRGKAEARNLKVMIDGTPLHEHPIGRVGNEGKASVIGPGGSTEYSLIRGHDDEDPSQAVITWSDDSGQPGKTSLPL